MCFNSFLFIAIAVASGAHIYIYKNMRPFYKFTLPASAICPSEMEAWSQAKNVISLSNVFLGVK